VPITLTYDQVLSRVRVTGSGFVDTTHVTFERSTDRITWTTVRGGVNVPVAAGMARIDDYEFSPNVLNYYRVTGPSSISYVSTGTAAHQNNASVTPGIPAGVQTGDLLLINAAIRTISTATPNTPTGYSALAGVTGSRLFGKIATSSAEVAPTVSFTGGAANNTTSAQMSLFRGAALAVVDAQGLVNLSQQNMPFPSLTTSNDEELVVYVGQKIDDWTSVDTVVGATEIGESSSTLGDDQGIVWDYRVAPQAGTIVPAGSFVVTGGAAAVSFTYLVGISATSFTVTGSITPLDDRIWIKSLSRPFLNRALECVNDISDIVRQARNGVFDVVGRSFPVAVTDVRGSRRFSIKTITSTTQDRENFDFLLASGDPVYVQSPPGSPVPRIYAVIQDTSENRPLRSPTCNTDYRVFTLPLIEVAAPGPDVVGSVGTWQTVVNTYATWADVIAANATWFDLLSLVGSPSEVIVP
jgi:hypothetical protein